jgi:hypothetical protein
LEGGGFLKTIKFFVVSLRSLRLCGAISLEIASLGMGKKPNSQ